MREKIVRIVGAGLIVWLALIPVSCSSVPEPEYASGIAEQMLQAINQDNYDQFAQYFDENIQKIMPEKNFHGAVYEVKTRVGSYQSKEFLKAEDSGFSIIVYYIAHFTEEPEDVIVEIRFKELEGGIRVSAFSLDSPKLRGN